MNLLMIGAGIHRREGWTTLDANPKNNPDILAILPPLPAAVTDVEWDEIEWIHGVTSFYPWDAFEILSGLRKCLKSNGRLVLEQPNFEHARDRVEWLFGDPMYCNPLLMNKWAYTPDSLRVCLYRAGFTSVTISAAAHHVPSRDFRLEATR